MQTRDEKLEIAAGEYGQNMKKMWADYICLVDAFIAGAKWMQTEQYYNSADIEMSNDEKKAIQEFYNKIGGVK